MSVIEEAITADPQVDEMIARYRAMSYDELLEDILRHEKEVRGIDWRALAAQGPEGIAEARRQSDAYAEKLYAELGVSDADAAAFRAFRENPDLQLMPAWGINQKEADEWKNADGERLGDMVLFRLKIMQSLELSSGDIVYAQIGLSIGVVAWLKRGYDLYKAARAAGATSLSAVVQGIRGVTLGVTKAFVATVIVAIIAEVILYLLEKNAVVYNVLVNLTDEDLTLQGVETVNGKQIVQFVDPLDAQRRNTLNKRTVIDIDGVVEANYWLGLFAASKKQMAGIGSLGSFNFEPTRSFPDSVYVGWEIPLSLVIGGPNRCLVSAHAEGSNKAFAERTNARGSLFSTSSSGTATVTGRMHSGRGSEGYMSVIFEPR